MSLIGIIHTALVCTAMLLGALCSTHAVAAIDDPRVVVLPPLAGGAQRSQLTAVGERLYFVVHEGGTSSLWTDAVPPSAPAKVFEGATPIDGLAASEGRLLFERSTTVTPPIGVGGYPYQVVERWVSDGSVEGTRQYDVTGGGSSVLCGGQFYTVTPGDVFAFVPAQLRRSDGSLDTSAALGSADADSNLWIAGCFDGALLLAGSVSNIGASDQPSSRFSDALMDTLGARQFVGQRVSVVDVNGVAYVGVTTPVTDGPIAEGTSIIRTDGSEDGTRVVMHVPRPAEIRMIGRVADQAVWIGSMDGDGEDDALWVTDGTAGNRTQLVEVPRANDLRPVGSSATVFFFTMDPALWRTDGTAAGTFPIVSPFAPEAITAFAALDDVAYLGIVSPASPTPATQLWRSDGTEAGTIVLGELGPSVSLARVGERLFVSSDPMALAHQCYGAALPLARELELLEQRLICGDGVMGLRPRQARRLARLARQAGAADATGALVAHRAGRFLQRLQRRFGARRGIARVGRLCAEEMAECLRVVRVRIGQRETPITTE